MGCVIIWRRQGRWDPLGHGLAPERYLARGGRDLGGTLRHAAEPEQQMVTGAPADAGLTGSPSGPLVPGGLEWKPGRHGVQPLGAAVGENGIVVGDADLVLPAADLDGQQRMVIGEPCPGIVAFVGRDDIQRDGVLRRGLGSSVHVDEVQPAEEGDAGAPEGVAAASHTGLTTRRSPLASRRAEAGDPVILLGRGSGQRGRWHRGPAQQRICELPKPARAWEGVCRGAPRAASGIGTQLLQPIPSCWKYPGPHMPWPLGPVVGALTAAGSAAMAPRSHGTTSTAGILEPGAVGWPGEGRQRNVGTFRETATAEEATECGLCSCRPPPSACGTRGNPGVSSGGALNHPAFWRQNESSVRGHLPSWLDSEPHGGSATAGPRRHPTAANAHRLHRRVPDGLWRCRQGGWQRCGGRTGMDRPSEIQGWAVLASDRQQTRPTRFPQGSLGRVPSLQRRLTCGFGSVIH